MKPCVAGIVMLALISGCSSAGNLRDSTPTAVYVGSNSASDVISCVSDAWAAKKLVISTVSIAGGTSLQLQETDDGPVVALVDIAPSGANTRAKYYSSLPYDDTWFFEQVKRCM